MCVMHGWDGLQTRVLVDDAGTVLVMGGPGTGRTSVCLEIAARHVAFGGRLSEVLVLAQTRPSAQALRTALVRRLGGAHLDPQVMTVHALARRIVASPSKRLLTAPEQEFRMGNCSRRETCLTGRRSYVLVLVRLSLPLMSG